MTSGDNAAGNTPTKNGYTEIVGLFHSIEDLEKAISYLTGSDWHRSELSLLSQHKVFDPDHVERQAAELADDPNVDRQPPFSEVDMQQGRTLTTSVSGAVGAVIGAGAVIISGGGTVGAIVGALVIGGGAAAVVEIMGRRASSKHERFLKEQVEKGGIPLWVKIESPEQETKARSIFEDHGATHVQMHGKASEPQSAAEGREEGQDEAEQKSGT